MKTNGNASLPPWGELEGGCTNGNASTLTRLTSAAATSKLVLQPRSAGKATSKTILNRFLVATPLGELEGGQTLYDGENVIEMNKDLEELEQELRRRVVRFWYQKKNGEWREAIGTRRLSLIPEEQHPNGTGHQPDFLVCYWDLERNHWRCFDRNRFIGFDEQMVAEETEKTEETEETDEEKKVEL